MTIAGWITMILCWSFVTGFSVFRLSGHCAIPATPTSNPRKTRDAGRSVRAMKAQRHAREHARRTLTAGRSPAGVF